MGISTLGACEVSRPPVTDELSRWLTGLVVIVSTDLNNTALDTFQIGEVAVDVLLTPAFNGEVAGLTELG